MIWPFNRRRRTEKPKASKPRPSESTGSYSRGYPWEIPLLDTEHEAVITALLERAVEESAKHAPGAQFTVTLTEEEMEQTVHPMMIVAPVFFRAPSYGIIPESAYNEEFTFYREAGPNDQAPHPDITSLPTQPLEVPSHEETPEDFTGTCS